MTREPALGSAWRAFRLLQLCGPARVTAHRFAPSCPPLPSVPGPTGADDRHQVANSFDSPSTAPEDRGAGQAHQAGQHRESAAAGESALAAFVPGIEPSDPANATTMDERNNLRPDSIGFSRGIR